MIYSREEHGQFLEEELRAISATFKEKLETKATHLLQETNEVFVSQFVTFRESGEMLLKFPNTRSLPRKGEYLYCFTVPKELRNYRHWFNLTYGDLLKAHNNHSEGIVCIWQKIDKNDSRFSIVAFRGVEESFARNIAPEFFQEVDPENKTDSPIKPINNLPKKNGIFLLLGPNKPPLDYIVNLQKVVAKKNIVAANKVLDFSFTPQNNKPILLDSKNNIAEQVMSHFKNDNTLIIQGPPGTGKTYLIAELCAEICRLGFSVLVTSLTNRALMEVASKAGVKHLLDERKIHKSNLSMDERKELKNIQNLKDIVPMPGQMVLSSFFFASKLAANINSQNGNFDFVIVDEASQAFLSTLAMSKVLGAKTIWVGDCNQLAPISMVNSDRLKLKNWKLLSDGLFAMSQFAAIKSFQLTDSYRLTVRASNYTGLFYNDTLRSKAPIEVGMDYAQLPPEIGALFNPKGGPSLIKTDLGIGETAPEMAITLILKIVPAILVQNKKLHIAILSKRIATVKALQKAINTNIENPTNILIDTVDRVQGLTTDITFFVVPNTSYFFSLEKRFFNVATSRSRFNTLIIADKNILNNPDMDTEVKRFLQQLNMEFSFYVKGESTQMKIGEG